MKTKIVVAFDETEFARLCGTMAGCGFGGSPADFLKSLVAERQRSAFHRLHCKSAIAQEAGNRVD